MIVLLDTSSFCDFYVYDILLKAELSGYSNPPPHLNHECAHGTSGAQAVLFVSYSDIVELYTPYQGQFQDSLLLISRLLHVQFQERFPFCPIDWSVVLCESIVQFQST
jgi:hypothetical protein